MDKHTDLDICQPDMFFSLWLTFFKLIGQRYICGYYDQFVAFPFFTFLCMDIFSLSQNSSVQFKCTCFKWAVSHLNITVFLFSLSCDDIILSVGLSIPALTVATLLNRVVAMANINVKNCASYL